MRAISSKHLRPGRVPVLAIVGAVLVTALGGCDRGVPVDPDRVNRLVISAPDSSLRPGRQLRASVIALDRGGNAVDADVEWRSLTPVLLSVTLDGTITALAPGIGIVRASVGSVSADFSVQLVNPPAATIDIASDTLVLFLGGNTVQLQGVARDSAGEPLIGAQIVWSSEAVRIASVNGNGALAPVAVGVTVISASLDGVVSQRPVRVRTLPSEVAPIVTGVLTSEIVPGVAFTVTGERFAPTMGGNTVLVDGLPATVTSASTSQLTVVLGSTGLPCVPTRNVQLQVTTSLGTGAGPARLSVATKRTLAPGEALLLTSAGASQCNEFAAGGGRYIVSVQHAARALGAGPLSVTLASASGLGDPTMIAWTGSAAHDAASLRRPDAHLELLVASQERARRAPAPSLAPPHAQPALQIPPANGIVPVRIPDLTRPADLCTAYSTIGARAVYEGTRVAILEDTLSTRNGTPTLAGQMDNVIAELGAEFENVIWPLITRFGDPLVMDGRLDANGKIVLVLTPRMNEMRNGELLGAVVTCDFYSRAVFPASNVGEVMYLQVPTSAAAGMAPGTRERWRYDIRGTIVHELKHIVGFAERIVRGQPLEELWLEEATARHAEELFARALLGTNPVGDTGYEALECEVDAPKGASACANVPRMMRSHFEGLWGFLDAPWARSPLGPTAAGDLSFYGSAWSLTRWAMDHAAVTESHILQGLTTSGQSGLANLEARVGRSWDDILGRWSLALMVESRAGFVPLDQTLRFPSWNLASVFEGLCVNAGSCAIGGSNGMFGRAVPLQPVQLPGHSSILAIAGLEPGGFVPVEIAPGPSGTRRLIHLRAHNGGTLPATARIAILRVE
jgi:hypothetical protein